MKRQTPFTKQEVSDLQSFALSIGLAFARDSRITHGRRRICIHEAGHAVMYLGLGLEPWRIEIQVGGAESFMPAISMPVEEVIVMCLGGPVAEELLCGPKGVFLGALDDLWQIKQAADVLELPDVKALVQKAREEIVSRKAHVVALAHVLLETGSLSSGDFDVA
jgi:hypothetical protein